MQEGLELKREKKFCEKIADFLFVTRVPMIIKVIWWLGMFAFLGIACFGPYEYIFYAVFMGVVIYNTTNSSLSSITWDDALNGILDSILPAGGIIAAILFIINFKLF